MKISMGCEEGEGGPVRWREESTHILAEFATDGADLFVEGGGVHHHLLLVWGGSEDRLDIFSHRELGEHAIALVHHEVFGLGEIKGTSVGEVEDSAGGSDDNVRLVVLKSFDALSDVDTCRLRGGVEGS
jgi:hypothetical protein